MKRIKSIGLLSILLTIPSFVVLLWLLIFLRFPYSHWLVIEKLAITLCGIVGGLILIANRKYGYIFLLLALLLVFFSAISRISFVIQGREMTIMSIMQSVYEIAVGFIIILLFWKNAGIWKTKIWSVPDKIKR